MPLFVLLYHVNFINRLDSIIFDLRIKLMETPSIVDRLLKNMGNMHELGRQLAFELGNPFYAQFEEDGPYYRKEMPTGEKYFGNG